MVLFTLQGPEVLDVDVVDEVLDPEELLEGGGERGVQVCTHWSRLTKRDKERNEDEDHGRLVHRGHDHELVQIGFLPQLLQEQVVWEN